MPRYSPFQRAHRRAARWALYGGALLSGLAVFAAVQWFDEQLQLDLEAGRTKEYWESLQPVRLLQGYLRLDTSEREIEGARYLAEALERAGLMPVVEELGDGRANLWAILEGERRDAIVLHNHIDVFRVIDAERWNVPPFEGRIEPPFLYGRGAFDMKSLTIAQLEAITALAADGRRPRHSVIFLATADEESGSRLGTRWVLRAHPELVDRFALVLTEGGVVEPVRLGEIKYWGIEVAQKRFARLEVCAPDRERLDWLRQHLTRRQRETALPRVTDEVATFLETYVETRQDERMRRTLKAILAGEIDLQRFRRLPPYLRSLFLDEIVPFAVQRAGDHGYRLPLVVHLLPGSELAEVLARHLPAWTTHGLSVAVSEPTGAAHGSTPTGAAYRVLESELRRRAAQAPIGPYFLSWSATDARYYRAAGIDAYGFSPFMVFSTESYRADTTNERINLPGFVDGVDSYVEAVRRLATEPGALAAEATE